MQEKDKTEISPSYDEELNTLKLTYIEAATSIDKMKEPRVELIVLSEAMRAAHSVNRCGTDPVFAKFFYEDLAPGLIKRLHKERSNDENYLKAVADVLEIIVKLFVLELQNKRFNFQLYSSMTLLFNHEAVIHKYHYQIPDIELQKLRTFGQEWRSELKVGDMVDVYGKADDRNKLFGWMQAQIVAVNGDSLSIEFPLSSNFYDGKIDRWSTDLVKFESKTKQDYEWRRNVLLKANMLECDVHDKSSWNKSTVFELKKQTVGPGRVIDIAYCALRVYRDIPNSARKDERGTYEGWSIKFDEWVPVFSPRIMPWGTKVGVIEEDEIVDDLDELIQPDDDFKKIYAVPRLQVCISALYLRYINIFGNEGGFDIIIDLLKNPNAEKEHEGVNITLMGVLAQILTLPYQVFHKNFIQEHGQLISNIIKQRLILTTEQALRDVRKEQIDGIIKSVDNISRRFLSKDEREKQSEILRLELCNKSLRSSYLERRIQGIKDLNLLIKNNTLYSSSKTFTTDFLIQWMIENDVFISIWDPRKTHIQIVQRTNEIFKLLLKEQKLDEHLLKLVWSLSKSDYQSEVLKIIQECSYYLQQPQIEFLFNDVTSSPAEKLTLIEFDLLCDLGKQSKNKEFLKRVGDFFWHIIVNAENYKEDLVDNATKKFSEMVKQWSLEQKQTLFNQIVDQIKKSTNSILPLLRLFTNLIKDQKDRVITTSYSTTTTTSNQQVSAQFTHVTASGQVLTSYSYSTVPTAEESIYNVSQDATPTTTVVEQTETSESKEKELTFTEVLNKLQTEQGLIDSLLNNLFNYCKKIRQTNPDSLTVDRKKLFVLSKNFSHADEIEERLQFLKYYASVCDYQFRKVQLRVIYDSLSVESPIKEDQTEFLNWCKKACQESTAKVIILDLNEVGEYFSELMINKIFDVATLPLAGFEFLQNYFISMNENLNHLNKVQTKKKPVQQQSYGVTWNSYYITSKPVETKEDESEEIDFLVAINPKLLEKLNLIWMIVLNCQNQDVGEKAVKFLIKIYMSIEEKLSDKRGEFVQEFISECIQYLQDPNLQTLTLQRIILVLRSVIQESEKKGTGNVQPHNALLKGETLERIIIKNATRAHAPNLIVKVLTSATVWEFVDKISRMCDLAPIYVEIKLPNEKKIKETDYGKTLGQLGLRNHDIVTVKKNDFEDVVDQILLIDPATKKLVPKAYDLFSEWYDKYSNADGVMTPESAKKFILGATNELIPGDGLSDNRIKGLFDNYDSDKDGKLQRHEFIKFYEVATNERSDRVYDNIKNHFIRNDLLKYSEIYEDEQFTTEQMPRYTLSHNQNQFDTLMNLLDRNDGTSREVWELISMLATNQKMYQRVLSFEIQDADNTVKNSPDFWKKFFESGSIYKQNYSHEIIEALMQDSEDLTNRVFFVGFQGTNLLYNENMTPKVKGKEVNLTNVALKQNWTNKFLENDGLSFVINLFLQKSADSISNRNKFQWQEIKFMLIILKVFVGAAIAAHDIHFEEQFTKTKINNDNKLIESMKGEVGEKLLSQIDFKQLQDKLLQLIFQIVQKKENQSLEEKQIVSNSLDLWLSSILFQPELFVDFLETENVDNLILSGLLYCSEESIRKSFYSTLIDAARNLSATWETETPLGFLLKLLSKNFHQISKYKCRQFFDLFNELIDLHFIKVSLGTEEKDLFNPEDLLGKIIDKIRSDNEISKNLVNDLTLDETLKKEHEAEKESLMIGLVLLTQKLIGKVGVELSEKIVREKDLINEIFKEFLFSSVFSGQKAVSGNQENMLDLIRQKPPRKVSITASTEKQINKSREAAYQLLNELIKKSPVIMNNFIRDQLRPLLDMIKKPKTWNYTPPNSSERVQKYVGLKNLGCICYMNSMMQQFFMIPAFRYNLFCVDDGLPDEIKEYKGEQIDDNMLHQMQRLFAHLELSERSDYNPIGFTFSFKEFDGRPTNISEQKDAQEFLNVLFDRVERALKPTPRKYLLQSVFGGKTCSQLICPECLKVKNRVEDYYNLSLTVKDMDSVYHSLEKQIEGEVISDFLCEGCNKKVDVTKRTLLSETPNVLIIHLQRILFDFDTFRNEKMNQYYEFPTFLNLKPYSYHEVMRRENRLKTQDGKEADEQEEPIISQTEEKKDEPPNEDNIEPIEDDCFEYKLVGVNVHSGSANAGHYWSYINTERGLEEKDENDPTWPETEKNQWMEFNDSKVADYKFENLKDECYGDKPGGKTTASAWNFGGGYGKSGYMLFYERRVKKPIKIVVEAEQATNRKDITYDEKTKEHYKMISYKDCVDSENPNSIFSKVLEDNTKFTFENDVYSQDFFNFLKTILVNVAQFGETNEEINREMRKQAVEVAQKAAFDILARCFYNNGIGDIVDVMIQIFEQDEKLVIDFCRSILNTQEGEPMLEILLDCADSTARQTIGNLFRYLLCKIKMIEKTKLLGDDHEETVSSSFLKLITSQLSQRAAKAWSRFDKFLGLFQAFALYSPEEIIKNIKDGKGNDQVDYWNSQSEAAQVGLEYFFKTNKLEELLDFILVDKSPLFQVGQTRIIMGGTYSQPDFKSIMKVISEMIGANELVKKYPISEISNQMISNGIILGKIVEENYSNSDFSQMLSSMCFENLKLTKKLAKIFLKEFNGNSAEKIVLYLKAVKKFLLIKDSLQLKRLEWIFGVPQLKTQNNYRSIKYQYGTECVERINDTAYNFISTLSSTFTPTSENSLLERLLQQRGRMDDFCIKGVKALISLCIKDETIGRYIYRLPPNSFQYSRYSDWFKEYIHCQKLEQEKNSMNTYQYYQKRYENTVKTFELLSKWEESCQKFVLEDDSQLQVALETDSFQEVLKSWLKDNKEVIKHYPPQYIIGKQSNEDKVELLVFENEYLIVQLYEVECEYIYSNPTSLFNLSLPEKLMRTKSYTFVSYQQYQAYQNEQLASAGQPINEEIQVRDWINYHTKGPVILQVLVKSKVSSSLKVEIGLSIQGEQVNVRLPVTTIKETIFGCDTKAIAHFMKLEPSKDWGGKFSLEVKTSGNATQISTYSPTQQTVSNNSIQGENEDDKQQYCKKCAIYGDSKQLTCKICQISYFDSYKDWYESL